MSSGGATAGGLEREVGTVLDVHWSAEAATFRGSVEGAEDGMVLVHYPCDRKRVWHDFGQDGCTCTVVEPAAHMLATLRLLPPPAATVTDQEELSFQPGPGDLGNISIKTEAGEAEAGLGGIEHGLLTVKQRRPSSPMTPAQFRPASSQLFPGPGNSSDSQIYSSSGKTKRKYLHFP